MINIQLFLDKLSQIPEFINWQLNTKRTAVNWTFEHYYNACQRGEVYEVVFKDSGRTIQPRFSEANNKLYWLSTYYM